MPTLASRAASHFQHSSDLMPQAFELLVQGPKAPIQPPNLRLQGLKLWG
ncbi:MAG: hypothetical protein XD60_1423 [Acetothermia bacterium 64_32]|nr:MAG: hypothetical protein XD60_1423 [Acetothermia bacterium 64_32]